MSARAEVAKMLSEYLQDDPVVMEAMVMGEDWMSPLEPHVVIRTLTRLVMGQRDAINFLADELDQLRASADTR